MLTAIVNALQFPVAVQFAQKQPPCHSEASSIDEESACSQQRSSRFLARHCRGSE